jgi:hypothetical protein
MIINLLCVVYSFNFLGLQPSAFGGETPLGLRLLNLHGPLHR